MEFSEWITEKYVEWRGNAVGRDRTVTEFAAWIGVSQPLMSSWMKSGGKVPTSSTSIRALSSRYGKEVYDVLGIQPPAEAEIDFGDEGTNRRYASLSTNDKQKVHALIDQLANKEVGENINDRKLAKAHT